MDPQQPFFPLHPSAPFSPTAPQGYPSAHHPAPEIYQGTYYYHHGFNIDWGPAHQQQLLYHAAQAAGGESSTTGATVSTTSVGCRCQWLTEGALCSRELASFDDLMVHLAKEHDVQGSADRKMHCYWYTNRGRCGKKCRRDGMRRHIGTHAGCSFPCTECGKPFSRSDSMRAHAKKQHGKQ